MSIIDQIDQAVAIIPRGALFKTPFGPSNVNRTFEGEFFGAPLRTGGPLFPKVRYMSGTPEWTCPPWRSKLGHITQEDVPQELVLVVAMGYPVTGPESLVPAGWE